MEGWESTVLEGEGEPRKGTKTKRSHWHGSEWAGGFYPPLQLTWAFPGCLSQPKVTWTVCTSISQVTGVRKCIWPSLHSVEEESEPQEGKGIQSWVPLGDLINLSSPPAPDSAEPGRLQWWLGATPRAGNELGILFFFIYQQSISHFLCMGIFNYPNFWEGEKNDMNKQRLLSRIFQKFPRFST